MARRSSGSSSIPSMRKVTGPSPFGQVTQAVRASRIQPRPPPQSSPMRNQNGICTNANMMKKKVILKRFSLMNCPIVISPKP